MERKLLGTVKVEYSSREGYHIFTSPDLRGLYVANKDPEKAYNEVASAIELLLRLNERIKCKARQPCSFHDFLRQIKGSQRRQVPRPATLESGTYLLQCA